ncbi:AtzH-like domain-containing protein [Amnibacterium kyonggiense]|uniref:Asp-tRNA(Asn)/Glu-tRNA(Gln) amidotransferase A subunit family amidase n=1 Tax=Amnibacterium kyonggiense TaxID=595671 RepID=A0A4R7FPC0_9MICO|nr:AtzH-like domain-containing protein [Amnibacterium kyonggiense]TDS79585.1 Asp-tRNA(Asn)/Glu-tRNA(Gln) amidotransferase A subunit family amidase [Amnibacterium kyonggiense]
MPDPVRSAAVHADAAVPDGLLDAFWRYEDALMADDVPTLDALFAEGPWTLRGDAGGLLVGHDAIAAFRRGRGGAPQRQVVAVHVRVLDATTAAVVAVVEPRTGGRGQQTQVWRLGPAGWQVLVAHVAAPAPAVDGRVWREVGTPLVAGAGSGPLAGRRVAVKDLFAVAGRPIGAGVPAYLAAARTEPATAPAVQVLLDAGADLTGIARTDEFAYSIAGANPHYGTPPNARVPGGLPGGSSNGPASAVALGQADVGLGTDTGGSIRVPASYQGLWGLRTTHGRVPRDGLLPLAPRFDTVGWLTRDREVLAACSRVSAIGAPAVAAPERFAIAPRALEALEAPVREAFLRWTRSLEVEETDLGDLVAAQEAFRVVQAAEAWASYGAWLTAHPGAVSGAVADRFLAASRIDAAEAARARADLEAHRARLERAVDGVILLLPAAASVAPQTTADPTTVDRVRTATLRLTCVAGIIGAPSLAAPLLEIGGAPLGVALVGPRDSDDALVHRAAAFPAA